MLLISCEKSTDSDNNIGPATLSVVLTRIQSDQEDYSSNKISSTNINESLPPVVEIPMNKDISDYITLEEDKISQIQTKLKPSNKLAAKEISPVTPGVRYGILVYKGNNLIANGHKIFHRG